MALKTLQTQLDIVLACDYRRIDNELNLNNIRDNLRYIDLKDVLGTGNGTDKANILFHTRSTLNNTTEFWDLDGTLEDVFGDLLNYDAVKAIIIKHITDLTNAYLKVEFKNEVWYIGPNGFRVAWEPYREGISPLVSSASQEEGRIKVTSFQNSEYDIIVIGSTQEASSFSAN